jgi:adenylate kinase
VSYESKRGVFAELVGQVTQRRLDTVDHRVDEAGMVEVLAQPVDGRRPFPNVGPGLLDGVEVLAATRIARVGRGEKRDRVGNAVVAHLGEYVSEGRGPMPVSPVHRQLDAVVSEVGAHRGEERTVLPVDRAHSIDVQVVLGHLGETLRRDTSTGGDILEERHHVVRTFRPTERNDEHCVVGSHPEILAVVTDRPAKGSAVRVLLIGPPGSGKGTQGRRIAAHYSVTYLSSGELLRAQVAAATELGQRVADDLAAGDLVPDDLMLEVLHTPLDEALTSGGYVLDGFPRNVAQARELTAFAVKLGGAPEVAIWFDVEDAELVRRTRSRALTEGRVDDVDVVARHRIEVYVAATAPLIDHYRAQKLLIRIDAAQPVDDVTVVVLRALQPFAAAARERIV